MTADGCARDLSLTIKQKGDGHPQLRLSATVIIHPGIADQRRVDGWVSPLGKFCRLIDHIADHEAGVAAGPFRTLTYDGFRRFHKGLNYDRHRTRGGGAWLVRKGYLDQQTADSATGPIVDYVLGAGRAAGWAAIRARVTHSRLMQAWLAPARPLPTEAVPPSV